MQRAQSEIGANIAALRRAKGLTQEQLAFRLGVSAPAVSKWETGVSLS
ncbi:MAG TPA: helix-turn-helix domain-containing protein [Candidatus Gemmiger faecavium]|nr:helix-turn-helix domain-containing protein [Candidatus Gemmiger faecavium]